MLYSSFIPFCSEFFYVDYPIGTLDYGVSISNSSNATSREYRSNRKRIYIRRQNKLSSFGLSFLSSDGTTFRRSAYFLTRYLSRCARCNCYRSFAAIQPTSIQRSTLIYRQLKIQDAKSCISNVRIKILLHRITLHVESWFGNYVLVSTMIFANIRFYDIGSTRRGVSRPFAPIFFPSNSFSPRSIEYRFKVYSFHDRRIVACVDTYLVARIFRSTERQRNNDVQ